MRVRRLRGRGRGHRGGGVGGSLKYLILCLVFYLMSEISLSFRFAETDIFCCCFSSHHGWGVSRPTPRDRQGTHRAAISGQAPSKERCLFQSAFVLLKLIYSQTYKL